MDERTLHRHRFATGLAWALGGLLFTLVPATSQAQKTARGELLLRGAGGRAVVQSADGRRVELPLPATAAVTDLRSDEEGWLAAVVQRDGDAPALALFRGQGSEVVDLGAPSAEPVAEILQPTFVAGRGGVQGLVWLAGEAHHRLAVLASRRVGEGWSAPEVVSPPGPGTQIALSTAVLDDGSWMAVWAAFDGTDDEILWSRFSGGAWSEPRPVAEDNAVPDVTPHLVPAAGGALVAWSRFDGNDYRVNLARFDGETWSAPSVVGPRGSTAPAWSDARRPTLLYHRADPRGWGVMQLDGTGKLLREAAVELAEPERPTIVTLTERGVTLEWVSLERQKVSAPLAWQKQ